MEWLQPRRGTESACSRRRYVRRARRACRPGTFVNCQNRREARMTRVQDIYPDDRVSLREVGLRDGLQLVKTFPSTEAKQRWMRQEYGAGVRHFEVGSFLPATTFPQFADVRDIVRTVAALPGAHGIALALNERGVNEALASGVAEIATVVSATEEHSQAMRTARASRPSPTSSGFASYAMQVRTSRSSMRRSRWRWAVR